MANSQADFSNAMLMINGKVANQSGKTEQMLDPKGQPVYLDNVVAAIQTSQRQTASLTHRLWFRKF